jgi:hypothetical protein
MQLSQTGWLLTIVMRSDATEYPQSEQRIRCSSPSMSDGMRPDDACLSSIMLSPNQTSPSAPHLAQPKQTPDTEHLAQLRHIPTAVSCSYIPHISGSRCVHPSAICDCIPSSTASPEAGRTPGKLVDSACIRGRSSCPFVKHSLAKRFKKHLILRRNTVRFGQLCSLV